MFDLKRAWNCNMKLKTAVRRAEADGISKETVVKFWRESARKLGYWGSYSIPKFKANSLFENEEPEWYKNWKGEAGAGLELKQIISSARS